MVAQLTSQISASPSPWSNCHFDPNTSGFAYQQQSHRGPIEIQIPYDTMLTWHRRQAHSKAEPQTPDPEDLHLRIRHLEGGFHRDLQQSLSRMWNLALKVYLHLAQTLALSTWRFPFSIKITYRGKSLKENKLWVAATQVPVVTVLTEMRSLRIDPCLMALVWYFWL